MPILSFAGSMLRSKTSWRSFLSLGRRGKAPGTHEWVIQGLPYVIVDRVDESQDELTVLAIFRGAQDR
jgi:hypothetical protein